MGWKCPRGSGPSIRVSLTLMVPLKVVPLTTVPTPGTWYVSSIWNSEGSFSKRDPSNEWWDFRLPSYLCWDSW